ncbi:SLIT and NTRK-like protein 6 [Xenopus laevis]|uniref:SLIT and NTRK-like protein 6 n=2 Tax=Xenopus laevis TaxID=8355 RepID=A0A8J0UDA7_XENLA|nr:SLIT and NTRK-like protein 6 [Xenopus laevis]
MIIYIFLSCIFFSIPSGMTDSELLTMAACKTLCLCSEKDGIFFVNCEEKGILNLSEINIPPFQYMDLNLLNNGLFKIHENELLSLNNIISLHLGFNNIADIEPGAFNNLSILKKLHINHNSLEILRNYTFKGLENLEFLQADNNFINTIESNTFSKLTKLKVLILNDNAIESLPSNIFRFVPLTHLDLRGNQLQTLPYVGLLEHIGRITELQLEDNKWVCSCDLLQLKLWLENMPRQSIIGDVVCNSPPIVKGTLLRRLKNEMFCTNQDKFDNPSWPMSLVGTASIYNDRIPTKIAFVQKAPTKDPTLFIPPKLPTLLPDFYCPIPCHCSSHTLPGTLIHCQERNLESLSDIGPPPQNPRKLILAGNLINVLHKGDFTDYASLEMLHLGNNHIEMVEEESFYSLTKLQKLYLNGNRLRHLNPDMLIGLTNLEYLYLEFNFIKEILPGTFSSMSKLKILYLNNNLIQSLPDHIFSGVPLTSLNLKSNQFVTFPVTNVLEDVSSLLQIELQDNPWDCTCNIIGLRTWVQQNTNIMVSEMLCSNPTELLKKDLKSIQNEILCPELLNIYPVQSSYPPLVTTSTVDSILRSLSDSIPLSVVILGLLILLLTTVLCSAGIIVLVLHRRRRSKKKQVHGEIRETSPVHIQYSMYGHKTTHHTTERPRSTLCEQGLSNPMIQVYQTPPFITKQEEDIEKRAEVDSKKHYRSILERENDSPLTSSKANFRANDPQECMAFQDTSYLYRNMMEKENEIKQLGIAEYLRKNIAHLPPDLDIHYPRSHEEIKLMEALLYSRPQKLRVEQTQNEYFELKANLQAEPDYLEVLEQRT